jgi:NAD+ synthase|tara:strand:- start:1878 stop:2633 length:756 start_codon:yes stop_codon:yes gene_type:complete
MNRIKNYAELKASIVNWIKDYADQNKINTLVVGVSGGIDSAVVSTLCAETGLRTYVLSMPLLSNQKNDTLSNDYVDYLSKKYVNVEKVRVDLSNTYMSLMQSIEAWTNGAFLDSGLANANTKSRLRMVTLYQIAGSSGGIVVGTGNKVEDYGVGFYTKYGDGGVDIAPIADLYKTEVWELGKHLGVDQRIIDAPPTDGLWDDSRTDETQIGASYEQLEEAMETGTGPAVKILQDFNTKNKHKMEPIPTFKL